LIWISAVLLFAKPAALVFGIAADARAHTQSDPTAYHASGRN
jgi:hypothetical protein